MCQSGEKLEVKKKQADKVGKISVLQSVALFTVAPLNNMIRA